MDAYMPNRAAAKVASDEEGHLIYKGRRIPFIHYQSGFYYFSVLASRIWAPRLLLPLLLKYNAKEDTLDSSTLGKYLWKTLREVNPAQFNRNDVINMLSNRGKGGELRIVEILNKLIGASLSKKKHQ